jgi:DnaJ-class molecular chaperone
MERLKTQLGNSYWNRTGAYQKEYNELYEELVPSHGESDTINGELLRAVSRLGYEFCNNGNCNAIELETYHEFVDCRECDGSGEEENYEEDGEGMVVCDECGGSGEVEEECDGNMLITPRFQSFIDFIRDNIDEKKNINALEGFLLDKNHGYHNYTFDDEQMDIYNKVIDDVMCHILNTENVKLS